jgi:hypothetical protein
VRPLEPDVLSFPELSVVWYANTPRRLRPRLELVRRAAREVYATSSPAAA